MPVLFTLAHLSDPHLALRGRILWRDALSKRLLGYINWRRSRAEVHRLDVLDALISDLLKQGPDHVAVTGDLTNLALPAEIAEAAEWLRRLGDPHDVTVIPGNHDCYVAGALRAAIDAWHPYVAGDRPGELPGAGLFPAIRRRGPLALIGLSSAIVSGPGLATGALGEAQLDALADALDLTAAEGLCRIVIVHHPLSVAKRHQHKRLLDASAFRAVLATHGAEAVLHGHMHTPSREHIAGNAGGIPVIGVPSASAAPRCGHDAAGYALIKVSRDAGGYAVTTSHRTLGADGRFHDAECPP